jgi:hypothetical protein
VVRVSFCRATGRSPLTGCPGGTNAALPYYANRMQRENLKLLIVAMVFLVLLFALIWANPSAMGNMPVPTHRPR